MTFGKGFYQKTDNLPSTINEIKISDMNKLSYIKKVPFGCEIVEETVKNVEENSENVAYRQYYE